MPPFNIPPDVLTVPTVTSNIFFIEASPATVRITFGEQRYDDVPAYHHTAIILSASNARWLADAINAKLLEAEEAAQQQQPPSPQPPE